MCEFESAITLRQKRRCIKILECLELLSRIWGWSLQYDKQWATEKRGGFVQFVHSRYVYSLSQLAALEDRAGS